MAVSALMTGSKLKHNPNKTDFLLIVTKHISDLRRIRKSLSFDLAKQIALALVSSKLL